MKVLPLNGYRANLQKWENEVETYRLLGERDFLPKLIASGKDAARSWIVTERLEAPFLNHMYGSVPHPSDECKGSLVRAIIAVVREIRRCGLFWNDLSAHNILIDRDNIRVIDFGDASTRERHNHVAMLSWLICDIQNWKPISYEQNVYAKIHAAGRFPGEFSNLSYVIDSQGLAPELRGTYELLSKTTSLDEFLCALP